MENNPVIEIHRDGRWIPAARIESLGDEHARVEYLPDYVFGDREPWPISLTWPVRLTVDLEEKRRPLMPAFLYDLVPQGQGRRLLVQLLGLRDHDGLALPLLLRGAFNPIGALRIDHAVAFQADYAQRNPPPPGATSGFSFPELADRQEAAVEYLATHSMLASGTTGVQGQAPKFLLAMDQQGQLHPDLALPDAQARSHWLVKGARGRHRDDELILRSEAAYLRLAADCGLQVDAVDQIQQHGRWLLVPNTDNHARNHAVQRRADGSIRLTPLYDFAPMFKDPELIPRALHWVDRNGRSLREWPDILPHLPLDDAERQTVQQSLRAFSETVGQLPERAAEAGVDAEIIAACATSIDAQAESLAKLS